MFNIILDISIVYVWNFCKGVFILNIEQIVRVMGRRMRRDEQIIQFFIWSFVENQEYMLSYVCLRNELGYLFVYVYWCDFFRCKQFFRVRRINFLDILQNLNFRDYVSFFFLCVRGKCLLFLKLLLDIIEIVVLRYRSLFYMVVWCKVKMQNRVMLQMLLVFLILLWIKEDKFVYFNVYSYINVLCDFCFILLG